MVRKPDGETGGSEKIIRSRGMGANELHDVGVGVPRKYGSGQNGGT